MVFGVEEVADRGDAVPDRRLAEDLMWWRGDAPIAAFAAYFRARKAEPTREDRKALHGKLNVYVARPVYVPEATLALFA